jgi:V8-like Glu-specific endopeptidase
MASPARPHDPPLLLDEIAKLPDLPATEEAPEEVVAQLAERRLHIAGVGDQPESYGKQLRSTSEGDSLTIELPEGAFLGQPGHTGERLERAKHDVPQQTHTEPMRPAWAAQSFQPRHADQMTSRRPMRTIDGRQVEPYYGVFGADDRQVYYPDQYPWRCVGRIFTWTNWAGGGGWSWWGSGVLVGPRHVLTAGHVCPWGASSWAMRFVPNYWNGAALYGAGAESYASDYRGWNTNQTVAAHDIGVLRLYNPIGSSLGWMGTKVFDSAWRGGAYWTLTGYPAAIAGGERPSYQASISVDDDDNDGDAKELEHHGDATGGDSGGPFFGWWGSDPYSVGVTSGGERITGTPFGWGDEDNNIEAGGRAMVDLVSWALTNWP